MILINVFILLTDGQKQSPNNILGTVVDLRAFHQSDAPRRSDDIGQWMRLAQYQMESRA